MTLLPTAAESEIRAAIKAVTDTFMVTPVTYSMMGESIDRWQEDRTPQEAAVYTIPCLVEYTITQEIKESLEGAVDDSDIMLTANIEDLEVLSLTSAPNWTVPFNPTKDYFVCKGVKYKVMAVTYDGALSTKQCLVIIIGKKDIKPT